MSARASEWQVFLLAVQFLTRLPVPRDLPFSNALLIRATRYYPLVGGLIGTVGALVLYGAAQVWTMGVAVLLSVAATILITGAFHEDGLADAADGLGGGLTRERALEIMRDSRIGTYGTGTLGLVLALKVAVLAAMTPGGAAAALIAGHMLSRMATVTIIATHDYARETGAKFVAPTVSRGGFRFALLASALPGLFALLWFGFGATLTALAVGALAVLGFRRIFLRKLGGYTGDCLGAVQQLAELGFYLGLAAWL
ncbi:adenosylcobinamide-GDP ribazoletransferase [Marivita sp. GX14005]|uniref:adenosylcobinamide-GDP ribazoletransferase n=1 Tax=Marivita sp. GX14005 TaxID=2942276 RepID=UPI002019FACE|nr:adenosylcobinamide-GDP ribazoletransferase [Marivita sp. GX14005]MCL3883410.1 adenosylcobinamide-GDP ribazoletransferase [Marivita sp. GX14005]